MSNVYSDRRAWLQLASTQAYHLNLTEKRKTRLSPLASFLSIPTFLSWFHPLFRAQALFRFVFPPSLPLLVQPTTKKLTVNDFNRINTSSIRQLTEKGGKQRDPMVTAHLTLDRVVLVGSGTDRGHCIVPQCLPPFRRCTLSRALYYTPLLNNLSQNSCEIDTELCVDSQKKRLGEEKYC